MRYPGHRDLMQFLLGDLGLKGDQQLLKDIMRKSMPATMQDVVLVFVTVSGQKNGVLLQEVFARKIFAQRDGAQPLSGHPDHHRRRHLRCGGLVPRRASCRRAASSARSRSRCLTSWPTASARPTSSRRQVESIS